MAPLAAPQRQRLRWIAISAGVLVCALLTALAIHISALLQPQRFTGLLERELASVGIELELQAPASPALFPRPAVRMQGFSLTNSGSSTPVLQADGAVIVVPWRALLHGEVAIERVEVDAPRIDLGQLKTLLARLPRHRGPPQLPTIAAGVHMVQGTLANGGTPLLFGLDVDTGELVPGHPFRMDASARDASGHRITASLNTVPSSTHDGVIDLNPLQLAFRQQDGASLQLAGQGQWQGGQAVTLHLDGDLKYPALAPPPAVSGQPAASGSATAAANTPRPMSVDRIVLDVKPPAGKAPLDIAVQLQGADTDADFHLQPTEFGAWWQRLLAASPEHPPGPLPFAGKLNVQAMDLGWVKATGLHIEADPDLAPASASTSSAAPSPVPSTAH